MTNKKTYKFAIKKKIENKRTYYIKKRTIVQQFMEMVLPKKKKKKAEINEKTVGKKRSKKKTKKSNTLFKILGIFGVIIFLLIIALMLMINTYNSQKILPVFTPSYSFSYENRELLDSGAYPKQNQDAKMVASFDIAYKLNGINNISGKGYIYKNNLPNQAFLLKYAVPIRNLKRYDIFKKTLFEQIKTQTNLNIKEIPVEAIEKIPKNSYLIIPTGYMPEELLQKVKGRTLLERLIARGNIVIYIGMPFGENGDLYLKANGQVKTQDYDSGLSFKFDETPYYSTTKTLNINKRTYLPYLDSNKGKEQKASTIYGGVVPLLKIGRGHILFLTDFVENWDNPKKDYLQVVEDIKKIITDIFWIQPMSSFDFNVENIEKNSSNVHVYTSEFPYSSRIFIKIDYTLQSSQYNVKKKYRDSFTIQRRYASKLYFEKAQSSYLSNEKSYIELVKKIDFNSEPKYLSLYFSNGNSEYLIERIPKEIMDSGTISSFGLRIPLVPGQYTAYLKDNNKTIASAYVTLPDIEFENIPTADMFTKGIFNFTIKYPRQFINELELNKRNLKITFDGKSVDFEVKNNQIIVEMGSRNYEEGEHEFVFRISPPVMFESKLSPIEKTVKIKYVAPQTFFTVFEKNPMLLVAAGIAFFIFIGSPILAKILKKDMYSLDIPNFPALKKQKYHISIAEIKKIFERVNQEFSWKYMPLKLNEIKYGFSKIIFRGRPLHIGDFDLLVILDQLEKKGVVEHYLDYYALSEWKQKVGDLYKKSMYRYLRDIFVDNAILFSEFKESNAYDVRFRIFDEEKYILFYNKNYSEIIKRIIYLRKKKKQILVITEGYKEKQQFENFIQADNIYSKIISIEKNLGNITILTLEEFAEYVRKAKS